LYCTFTSDGQHLFVASEKEFKIYNGNTFEILVDYPNPIFYYTKQSIAFSSDERDFAFVFKNKNIAVWDRNSLSERLTLTGHTAQVNALVFSPDGKLLASASKDKTVKLWDVATGKLIGSFAGHKSEVVVCAFNPSSEKIVSIEISKSKEVIGIYWDIKSLKSQGTWGISNETVEVLLFGGSVEFASNDVVVINAATRKIVVNAADGFIILFGYSLEPVYNVKINQGGVYKGKIGNYCPVCGVDELLFLNTNDLTTSSLSVGSGSQRMLRIHASRDFQHAIVLRHGNPVGHFVRLQLHDF